MPFVLMIVASLLLSMFNAAVAMVLIGMIHHDVIPQVPAFGFWETFLLYITVRFFTADSNVDVNGK